MGSRLYFPFAATPTAGVTPAFDASWAITAGAVRRYLAYKPTGDGSANNSRTGTESIATNPAIVLIDQYISDPLPANKAISGTVLASIKGRANGNTDSVRLRIVVKVVSNNGSIIRAVLFSGISTATYGEAAPFRTLVAGGSLTSYSAVAGDRIVVERGLSCANSLTTAISASIAASDPLDLEDGATTDLGDPSNITVDKRAWVEFSQDDIWGPPKPTTAGLTTRVLEAPVRPPLRVAGLTTPVLEKPVRPALRVAGMVVNALIPRAGQRARSIYAAGFPDREPRVKLPDGRWVPLKPYVGESVPTTANGPMVVYSDWSTSRSVPLTFMPLVTDLLVFMSTSKDVAPRQIFTPPTGIPGVAWEESYRSLDDRNVVWLGTGATGLGTATFMAYSTDGTSGRASALFVVRNTKKVLAFQQGARVTTADPVVFSSVVGSQKQVSLLNAAASSANPDPTVTKPDDWVTLQQDLTVVVAKANPLVATSEGDPDSISIAHSSGIAGQLVVVGGDVAYTPPFEGLPIPSTTRYYGGGGSTNPIAPGWSSKWASVNPNSSALISATTTPQAIPGWTAVKPSPLPNSSGAGQLIFPPLSAGVIAGTFRLVWPTSYIGTAYLRAIFRLVSKDGSVERGELADVTSDVLLTSTVSTRFLQGSLIPLVAQRGDRIVLDLGTRFTSGNGASSSFATSTGVGPDYDAVDNQVQSAALRPWVELIPN